MDKQWLDKNASYMDFNVRSEYMNISSYVSTQSANVLLISCLWCHYQEVLKSTRAQLERELMLDDVIRIEDMPSYSLLC